MWSAHCIENEHISPFQLFYGDIEVSKGNQSSKNKERILRKFEGRVVKFTDASVLLPCVAKGNKV